MKPPIHLPEWTNRIPEHTWDKLDKQALVYIATYKPVRRKPESVAWAQQAGINEYEHLRTCGNRNAGCGITVPIAWYRRSNLNRGYEKLCKVCSRAQDHGTPPPALQQEQPTYNRWRIRLPKLGRK